MNENGNGMKAKNISSGSMAKWPGGIAASKASSENSGANEKGEISSKRRRKWRNRHNGGKKMKWRKYRENQRNGVMKIIGRGVAA
jgi:hypothetical protein